MSQECEPLTVVQVYGGQASTCGYCTNKSDRDRPGTSRTVGMSPLQMSCSVYKRLLDRGWRRSGDYLYKPNLEESCCPQYTIKLDAVGFQLSKNQRKALHRWNKFLVYGEDEKSVLNVPANKTHTSVVDLVHAADASVLDSKGISFAHKFEVTLEPSSFTDEKYQLYLQYQKSVHNDTNNTPSRFKGFLVESAIRLEPIPYKNQGTTAYPLPTHYGSYHQMYRVDGKLVAMGVVDILPGCVSSVYFIYADGWAKWSLGKISAMREAALAKEIHDAGAEIVDSLYMGFYIHTCPKMKYKGGYQPSYLLDPESYTWHPFKDCARLLDEHKYAVFNDARSDPGRMSLEEMGQMQAVVSMTGGRITVAPLSTRPSWRDGDVRKDVEQTIATFGRGLRGEIIIFS